MSADTILTDPSDDELAAAVEENLFALFRAMTTLPDSELAESDKLSRHLAFPSNPMFKGVWRTHLLPSDVDNAIDETLDWFRERNAPFIFWWTGPSTQPDNLGEHLVARGLLSMEGQMRVFAPGIKQTEAGAPGMVADLHRVNEALLMEVPPDFTIEEVQDEAALHDFKQVFVESNEIPEWAGQAWVDATLNLGIGRTPWKMYIGRLDGKAVATNMLFNGGGVASVYGVATKPSARGKGIGAAITLKPLLEARDMGYRHAVLFSTEMGRRVYGRIGFHDCGVRLDRYLWRNEAG